LANVWLVGHSLGGALASLLGATYGLPAVAFEAPGERLAASRLHLPLPPPIRPEPLSLQSHSFWSLVKSFFPILGNRLFESRPNSVPLPSSHHPVATTHVYHTADPIPQGTCTGLRSPCANAGYALETRCHLGQSIVFDSVQKLRWKVDVRKHIIRTVVHDVLEGDIWWGDDNEEEYEAPAERAVEYSKVEVRKHAVPKPIIEDDCNVSSSIFFSECDLSSTVLFFD
jgi:lipase ATG15